MAPRRSPAATGPVLPGWNGLGVAPEPGTPYPGGIGWYECLDIIRTVARYGHVVAFDCVEFAPPVSGNEGDAHTAAALVYKTINAIMQGRGRLKKTPDAEASG